jgi:hypothetical protein
MTRYAQEVKLVSGLAGISHYDPPARRSTRKSNPPRNADSRCSLPATVWHC